MKAMILAAGLGTRLRPLTLERPKALVPVGNTPMIDRVINYLKSQSVREIVVNAHHHRTQMVEHLRGGDPFGLRIEVRVEEEILGTGGGIKNTEGFWDTDSFLVINGDILTNIPLGEACRTHEERGSLATLILHDRPPFNQVRIDSDLNILDISDRNLEGRLAFTGIHILRPALLSHLPAGVFSSIIACYQELIRAGESIRAHVVKGHAWRDIGTVRSYVEANEEALGASRFLVHPSACVAPTAEMEDWLVVGGGAHIGEKAKIRRSILWENVHVLPGVRIVDSVVTASKYVDRDLVEEIL